MAPKLGPRTARHRARQAELSACGAALANHDFVFACHRVCKRDFLIRGVDEDSGQDPSAGSACFDGEVIGHRSAPVEPEPQTRIILVLIRECQRIAMRQLTADTVARTLEARSGTDRRRLDRETARAAGAEHLGRLIERNRRCGRITGIADAISIAVELRRVVDRLAVVTAIGHAVMIAIDNRFRNRGDGFPAETRGGGKPAIDACGVSAAGGRIIIDPLRGAGRRGVAVVRESLGAARIGDLEIEVLHEHVPFGHDGKRADAAARRHLKTLDVLLRGDVDTGESDADGAFPLMQNVLPWRRGAGRRDRIFDASIGFAIGVTRSAVAQHDVQDAATRRRGIRGASRARNALHRHIGSQTGGEVKAQRGFASFRNPLDREPDEPDRIDVRARRVGRRGDKTDPLKLAHARYDSHAAHRGVQNGVVASRICRAHVAADGDDNGQQDQGARLPHANRALRAVACGIESSAHEGVLMESGTTASCGRSCCCCGRLGIT